MGTKTISFPAFLPCKNSQDDFTQLREVQLMTKRQRKARYLVWDYVKRKV